MKECSLGFRLHQVYSLVVSPIWDEPTLLFNMVYEKIPTRHIRSEIPPDNNDALLYIIVSLCIIIVVIELVFRAYSAYSWQRQRRYVKCDDVIFFVAAGLAICQFTLVIVQVRHGWGRSHIRVWGVYRRSHAEVMNKVYFIPSYCLSLDYTMHELRYQLIR